MLQPDGADSFVSALALHPRTRSTGRARGTVLVTVLMLLRQFLAMQRTVVALASHSTDPLQPTFQAHR